MLTQYEEKMQKSVENLEAEYATIRAGRANPNILNKSSNTYAAACKYNCSRGQNTGHRTMGAITCQGDREGYHEF